MTHNKIAGKKRQDVFLIFSSLIGIFATFHFGMGLIKKKTCNEEICGWQRRAIYRNTPTLEAYRRTIGVKRPCELSR